MRIKLPVAGCRLQVLRRNRAARATNLSAVAANNLPETRDNLPETIILADAPFVEGAVSAAVAASSGADAEAVRAAAEEARGFRKL